MTATVASDCTTITVDSTLWNASNLDVDLTLKHNNTTTYTVTVAASNVNPVVVDATALGISSVAEGIYYIELAITDSGNNVTTESLCVSLICSLHCDMVELYDDTTNLDKILAYEALKIADNCVECSCTVMQKLYDTATSTTDDTNCNCTTT